MENASIQFRTLSDHARRAAVITTRRGTLAWVLYAHRSFWSQPYDASEQQLVLPCPESRGKWEHLAKLDLDILAVMAPPHHTTYLGRGALGEEVIESWLRPLLLVRNGNSHVIVSFDIETKKMRDEFLMDWPPEDCGDGRISGAAITSEQLYVSTLGDEKFRLKRGWEPGMRASFDALGGSLGSGYLVGLTSVLAIVSQQGCRVIEQITGQVIGSVDRGMPLWPFWWNDDTVIAWEAVSNMEGRPIVRVVSLSASLFGLSIGGVLGESVVDGVPLATIQMDGGKSVEVEDLQGELRGFNVGKFRPRLTLRVESGVKLNMKLIKPIHDAAANNGNRLVLRPL